MNRFDGGVFLENIEWFDETGRELVHRIPEGGSGEIKLGAQLTVRESQVGVFFYKGKAIEAFCRLSDRPIHIRCNVDEPEYVIVQDAIIIGEA